MVNYLDILVAEEVYKERIRSYSPSRYEPELPSLAIAMADFGKQFQKLLAWSANTIVTYQGHRAPIGRRLAAKRN